MNCGKDTVNGLDFVRQLEASPLPPILGQGPLCSKLEVVERHWERKTSPVLVSTSKSSRSSRKSKGSVPTDMNDNVYLLMPDCHCCHVAPPALRLVAVILF
mmetsp:Transcript_11816/g.34697  ORF Transcript_11816/g.34697 Transcript_11816/m.34697 type:complete len:101 (+) Transcript_11816:1116-1418(+)